MSAAKVEKEVAPKDKISQEVHDMSSKIVASMTVGKKAGDQLPITVADDLYVSLLPEGITKETVSSLTKHNATFAAAAVLALGTVAEPVMKKDKTIERAMVVAPVVLKDKFTATYDRTRNVPNMNNEGKVDGTKPIYGVTSAKWESVSVKNRAMMANVKEMLTAQATASFSTAKK